jgi:hypothetical protein
LLTVATTAVPLGFDFGNTAKQVCVFPSLFAADCIVRVAEPHLYFFTPVNPAAYSVSSTTRSDGSSGSSAAKAGSSGTTSQPISLSAANELSVDGVLPPPPPPAQAARNINARTAGSTFNFFIFFNIYINSPKIKLFKLF